MACAIAYGENETTARELAAMLNAAGYRTLVCGGLTELLRLLAEERPALVAAGFEGAAGGRSEVIETLSSITPHARVVALHPKPFEIIQAATRAGVAAVLPRSISIQDFMYAVERVRKPGTLFERDHSRKASLPVRRPRTAR